MILTNHVTYPRIEILMIYGHLQIGHIHKWPTRVKPLDPAHESEAYEALRIQVQSKKIIAAI